MKIAILSCWGDGSLNYAKLVGEYGNSAVIFDASKLKIKDTEFAEVSYKTLLKILNRLEEEGLLSDVSEGGMI